MKHENTKPAPREIAITFDGSFDGFLCVVYACYYEKINPISIQDESMAQLVLDIDAQCIETNPSYAARVFSAIREKISEEAANYVYNAFLSFEDDRYMAILNYIRMGFSQGHIIDSHLQNDCVRRVRKLAGHVAGEAHLLLGFCRFEETKQGVFYCKITPKNNVLPLVSDHFSQRLMGQAWIIHDKTHGEAAIFNGHSYIITATPRDAVVELADGEEETQEMWVAFFNALTIKARINPKLQRQLLPLHFRGNMTEFVRTHLHRLRGV